MITFKLENIQVYGIIKEKHEQLKILHWSGSTHESCNAMPLLLSPICWLENGTINQQVFGSITTIEMFINPQSILRIMKYLYKTK